MADDGRRVAPAHPSVVIEGRKNQLLWMRLQRLDYVAQIAAVEADETFHTEGFCGALQRASRVVSMVNPDVGLEHANLAMRITYHLGASCDPVSLRDLRALAFAYVGEARRVLGELRSAGDAFDAAQTLRARGTADPWIEAEIIGLEALLRLEERRITEAVTLFDRVLGIYAAGLTESAGLGPRARMDALVTKGWCFFHLAEYEAAESVLEEAQQGLEDSGEWDLEIPILTGLVWCAITLGRFSEAKARLASAIKKAEFLGNEAECLRLRRAEAAVDLAAGERGHAEQALREAGAGFARLKLGIDATLAWLALAKLEIEEGARRATLERTISKIVPALAAEAGREQLLQLFLFVSSCTQGKHGVQAVTNFAHALEETRRPSLDWWSEWGTVVSEQGRCDVAPSRAG